MKFINLLQLLDIKLSTLLTLNQLKSKIKKSKV